MARHPPPNLPPQRRTDRSPLIGVVADSGQLGRLAADNGADFLLALSAAEFRQQGVSTLSAFLPYRNSNESASRLAIDHLLAAGSCPVYVGLMPGDPTCDLADRLALLRSRGVSGIVNYPSVTLIDGILRSIYEEAGCTIEAELELLAEARDCGLATFGFVAADPAVAQRFAATPLDGLIVSLGVTRELEDIVERRDRVDRAIRQLNEVAAAVQRVRVDLPCLAFGGPITTADDLEVLLRQEKYDGFVGGSVFSRLPVEKGVGAAIRRFKSVRTARHSESPVGLGPLIGASPAMRSLYQLIERSALYDLNVCIEGESGTGKELVATEIHRLSRRQHGPLVTLNCGAIPDSLLESELFGHERGSFTGAERRRLGKFELADGGILFLDEVGDLSPRGQVALLRAIQQREVTRVGGETPIEVDCRIVCATNQPLESLVAAGRFRQDLFYRLNHLTLAVPPLRDRTDDIPLLVEPILAALRIGMHQEVTELAPVFLDTLKRHAWPGNVRELQHVIHQTTFLEDGPILTGTNFQPARFDPASPTSRFAEPAAAGATLPAASAARPSRLDRARRALDEADGNKSRAAATLGISRKTLYQWLRAENSEP
jgi:two-component system, NtrC family, response regulator HydG